MIRARVLRKSQEAIDICSFELASEDGDSLPAFSAGAHVDVHLPGGLVRQYSLCNDPVERQRYRIAVLRDPGSRGGSVAMHDLVHEGDQLQISEPRNHFPLVDAGKSLLFAGGIGVTPILCMARHLHAIGAEFEMHYCTRSKERSAFLQELENVPFASRVRFYHDDGPASQALDLQRELANDPSAHVYVCGPQGFIEWVRQTAATVGLPADQVHLEYFGAAARDPATDRPFEVTFASSGATYTIPADRTVTQALREFGVEILTSCEQGVCGTCLTRVLEGECDHRDLYLTDEERQRHDRFAPCCSRAKSARLVLDL